MPRTARASRAHVAYHVINRGKPGLRIFDDPLDRDDFVRLLAKSIEEVRAILWAYCVMTTHFHLVVSFQRDGELSTMMQRLLTRHVVLHHQRRGTYGRVYQGRFKAFPMQDGEHALTVLRYVERNAQRANLVARAEDWPWSSAHLRAGGRAPIRIAPLPDEAAPNWLEWVNRPVTDAEIAAVRASVKHERPYGDPEWVKRTARVFGLESTLRSVGRPRAARPEDGMSSVRAK